MPYHDPKGKSRKAVTENPEIITLSSQEERVVCLVVFVEMRTNDKKEY